LKQETPVARARVSRETPITSGSRLLKHVNAVDVVTDMTQKSRPNRQKRHRFPMAEHIAFDIMSV
jgi:hypothetical protein